MSQYLKREIGISPSKIWEQKKEWNDDEIRRFERGHCHQLCIKVKVKVSIMMKAGDKMITCGTSPSSHTEKVKVAVFECESDNNRKWKQLLTYDTSHTLHLWAYSPKRNSFHSSFDTFLYFLWFTPEIIGHLVFLRAFAHRCYLHAVEAFGAALEKKSQRLFFDLWWIRSFQVWSYWFQIHISLAFTFPILNEMYVNIIHSLKSRSLAAASLILPFIW